MPGSFSQAVWSSTHKHLGQNAHGGLSCSVPDSCSALRRNAGLWRERGTQPMAGHSQAPAQSCGTASASKGTAAFLSCCPSHANHGQPRTCIWHQELRQAPRATATISTSSDSSSQGHRQPTVTGHSQCWERQHWGWEWEEAALSHTQVEGLLSWREPPWPTLFHQSLHRGTIWLSCTPAAQPGDAPLGAAAVFGPFQPQGWRQHWSHYTATQHKQKPGNQLRLLKHKPSTDKGQALPVLTLLGSNVD